MIFYSTIKKINLKDDKMSQFESMSISEQETSENKDLIKPDELPPICEDCSELMMEPTELVVDRHAHEEHQEEHHDAHLEHHHKESRYKQVYDVFLKELEQQPDVDAKLQAAINFMEAALSHSGTPHFKSFWDARNISLELFKQNISAATRASLWTKYTELSKEARRLKEILEEQSAFAAEQIEIAIQALEKDIENNNNVLMSSPQIEFSIECKSLEKTFSYYQSVQSELNLLNAQAARINALRKELIKTEMRIRQKNKFFQRLSGAGDKVFPRRKELIKDVSQHFIEDVDTFIHENFSKGSLHDSLFFMREEIKALQGMAKLLTLNTHSFTHTRLRLSECWDKIKGFEKDRKRARAQQKAVFKQNQEAAQQKINALNEEFGSGQLSIAEALKKAEEVTAFMRQIELGREELKVLREELTKARQPILDKQKQEEQERHNQEQERDKQRKQRLVELRRDCETLLENVEASDADKLSSDREVLQEKINISTLSKLEKQDLERLLKPLRDIISDKKERALMDLSEDDRQKLGHLKELLREKKERRQEIKNQLEVFRKAKGASGLDFEQAMNYNAQMVSEKERLDKISLGIKELEQMIGEIENRS